ncbi:formyltransferase family protein [Haloarchaeobius sp. HRN-SO-5]|uniref:formyltransferase family protein n=1 Tax=Haloarchaeobius sp. HRN-SO-5 TaxID=3446118 RepID=UPI003EB9BB6F
MSEISVAFFGSHPLGERCLERLTDHESVSVELVVTYPPDADNWWDGDLHRTASDLGHTVYPVSDEESVLEYDVDYLLSVYYPNILGPELLEHPNEHSLNLHQAELPRYRGSNVFTHSILNARADDHWKHGTTLHVMAESVDAGDVVDRRFAEITETDTAWSLYQKVRDESVALFEDALPKLVDREVDELRTPQSEFDGPRYFYRKSSLDGMKEIPLEEVRDGGVEVYDRIRALDFPPHEPAHTRIRGEKVYLTLNGYQDV